MWLSTINQDLISAQKLNQWGNAYDPALGNIYSYE